MTEQTKPDNSEAVGITEDALASFNNELVELQSKYKVKLVGIPLITPSGLIKVSLQVLDVTSLEVDSVEDNSTE